MVGTGRGFVVGGPYDSQNKKGAQSVAEAAHGIQEAAAAALATAQADSTADTAGAALWVRFVSVVGSPSASKKSSAEGQGVDSITLSSLKKYVWSANRCSNLTARDALVLSSCHGALKKEFGGSGLEKQTDKLTQGKLVQVLLSSDHSDRAAWEADPAAKLSTTQDKAFRVVYRNLSCLLTELEGAKQVAITSGAITRVSASVGQCGKKMENGTDRLFKIVSRYTKRANGTNTAPTVQGAHLKVSVEGGAIVEPIAVLNGGTGYMEGDLITLPPRGGVSHDGNPKKAGAVAATVKVDAVSVQEAGHVSFLKSLGLA